MCSSLEVKSEASYSLLQCSGDWTTGGEALEGRLLVGVKVALSDPPLVGRLTSNGVPMPEAPMGELDFVSLKGDLDFEEDLKLAELLPDLWWLSEATQELLLAPDRPGELSNTCT